MNRLEFLQTSIETAMQSGKSLERMSDLAYGRGNPTLGDHWGNLAIRAYTRAETASIELDALVAEFESRLT